ncbi:MAG: hypothetical protein AAGA62_18260, partial [Bacteroidota bacterium]
MENNFTSPSPTAHACQDLLTCVKYLWRVTLIVVLCTNSLSAQEPEEEPDPFISWEKKAADWERYAHLDGRFEVYTPGTFQEKVDSVDTPLGILVYHTFFFRPPSDEAENEVYMVSYVDYPLGSVHQDSTELLEAIFQETQDAATSTVRGELLFSQAGADSGHPYRYWRIDYLNGRASIRTKALVADNR